ncbi:MAG: metallophosphoesterase [Clostridia bacterium]|nr:metallophosphoesterase [Clostridia bacterium]
MLLLKIFAISDLHLPFGADKPMDIFGGWNDYTKKLKENWQKIISNDDTVIIPGDFSWTLKLEDALPDFDFLHSLNGNKILIKGNHDYWWTTANKINCFLAEHNFDDIKILFNNAYKVGKYAVCGTRGWVYDGTSELDEKVLLRECGRLETSVKSALELGGELKCFLHYPFVYGDYVCEEIYEILNKYGIKEVYFGHIHGIGRFNIVGEYKGIKLTCLSSDLIDFVPKLII